MAQQNGSGASDFMGPLMLFRLVAVAEACSWLGLLIGMFFKYVTDSGELGVKIFGPIHGCLFVAYVVTALVISMEAGWSKARLLLGLVCSVPPFMTIWFDRFAEKRDMLPIAWRTDQPDSA